MSYTNESLYELCKDHIGKPWWPSKLVVFGKYDGGSRYHDIDDMNIGPQLSADLILGAAVRWLVARESLILVGPCASPESCPCGDTTWTAAFAYIAEDHIPPSSETFSGQSLLAAVLAACLATEAA